MRTEKPIPKEVQRALTETEVAQLISYSIDERFKMEDAAQNNAGMQKFAEYLTNLLDSALDAELKVVNNKKLVNDWFKKNEGHEYFNTPKRADDHGKLNFIYEHPKHKGVYFHDGQAFQTPIFEYLIEHDLIVIYADLMHQGVEHRAWTTPRNKLILLNTFNSN